ncbi:MAG: hypothetical protein LBM27_00685 [Lactobacillaceae bacterium]|jgi:ATP-dependent DNA helicase DinG|nr:hypothetical protein [Lactobacillaceae bacterium]
MKTDSKFAVVDLEAIDTFSNGGRIIQIAITMVENWKITDSFNTFVNPQMKVPQRITDLTDITDDDVKNAPLFSEIAHRIRAKLEDTVFVAHNVNFDFNYLNGELAKAGLPRLNIERIDTIELTKILYPTFEKYSLAQLTQSLEIPLNHNHFANLDALATAQLLIKLAERAESLPSQTLKWFKKLNLSIVGQTAEFFNLFNGQKNLDSNLKDIGDGVLVANFESSSQKMKPVLEPVDIDDIGISTDLRIADRQLELSDLLFENRKYPKTVITSNRFGKTNTILYLSVLNAMNDKRTLILTKDKRAISHLKKKWNDIFRNYVQGDLFGEYPTANEFIDLNFFKKVLKRKEQGTIQTIKARVLVWLLETKTGAFSDFKATDMSFLSEQISSLKPDLDNPYYQTFIHNNPIPLITYTTLGEYRSVNFSDIDLVINSLMDRSDAIKFKIPTIDFYKDRQSELQVDEKFRVIQ